MKFFKDKLINPFLKLFKEENLLTQDDENFIDDSKAALISRSTFAVSSILYGIIALFTFLLIWAYFAKINQITIGNGKVIPSSQVKIIQSLDGGILQEINVQEGDIVKKDQILGHLDKTRYEADYQQAYAKYMMYLAQTARLKAESEGTEKISFPKILDNYSDLTKREIQLFYTRKKALIEEINNLKDSQKAAIDEQETLKEAYKQRVVSKVEYLRAQRAAFDIKNKILEKQSQFLEGAHTDYNKIQGEIASLTEALKSLADKMQRTTLRSPVYGIVKKIYVVTLGGVITSGQNIMEIVPLEDTLLVQARIKPEDIALVRLGQEASVSITAYDYSVYGSLTGEVKYVSADTIEESTSKSELESSSTKPSYYLVNVLTQKNYLEKNQHKYAIIPGMTATVHIMTGERTVLQYLLKPLLKTKQEALREK